MMERIFLSTRPGEVFSIRGLALAMVLGLIFFLLATAAEYKNLGTLGLVAFVYGFFLIPFKLTRRTWVKVKSAIDIRGAKPPIIPIDSSQEAFDLVQLPSITLESPEVKGEWMSIAADQRTLQAYAVTLDEIRRQTDLVTHAVINKFNADRAKLLEQQRNVMRRAFAARSAIARFRELPKIKISTANLPQFTKLSIPSIPNYLTPEAYAKKYSIKPANAVTAFSRSFATNGVNSTILISAAVASVIGVVMAKQLVSRSLRALEDARGQIVNASNEARNTLSILGRSHQEMVLASQRLRDIALEIDDLSNKAKSLPNQHRHLSDLPLSGREQLKTLWYWIICADQMAKNSVI